MSHKPEVPASNKKRVSTLVYILLQKWHNYDEGKTKKNKTLIDSEKSDSKSLQVDFFHRMSNDGN